MEGDGEQNSTPTREPLNARAKQDREKKKPLFDTNAPTKLL